VSENRYEHKKPKASSSANEADVASQLDSILVDASRIDSNAAEKRAMGKLLAHSGLLERVTECLKSGRRRAVLQVLLEWEAASPSRPAAFTEVLQNLDGWEKNDLAYHLRLLCRAGLLERVTDLFQSDDQDQAAGTGPQLRVFYRTTPILRRILRPYLGQE
jgi:hypothetical protein